MALLTQRDSFSDLTSCRSQLGLGLIEVFFTLALSGVLLAAAIPAIKDWALRYRTQATAQSVMSDIQQARSEAVMRVTAVQLRFSRHANGTCYVMHTGDSGTCRCSDLGQAVCTTSGQVLRVNWIPSQQRLSVRANVSNMSFQSRQGAVTSTGSIDIAADDGRTIRHIVSIAGRVRSCSPDGAFKSFARCAA